MANSTSKRTSDKSGDQALRAAYNDADASIAVNGFLVGKVGHKVTMALDETTVADDTEVYTFTDSGTTLYEITVVYTDATRETMISAERTA